MSKSVKFFLVVLFLLVCVSIGLNIFLLWQLQQLEQRLKTTARNIVPVVQESLAQTITDLETFEQSTIEFDVEINQDFPVQADIPFNETLDIPIQVTVPIKQEVNTTILIDPLKTGRGFPVDVTVPVDIEIPIDTTIPVSIDRTISISTTVPLDLDVPITVALDETELAGYIKRLRTNLTSFEKFLEQAAAELER